MFGFFDMMDSYEDRKIDNTVIEGNTTIDTCSVTDGVKPYETGISSPRYNGGSWVIVENYDTKEEAQAGHNKWVGIMSAGELPKSLKDCSNSAISQMGIEFGMEDEFPLE